MLTFNLKKEWFEKIKSGEKTHEYREVKPYWFRRLFLYSTILCRQTMIPLYNTCVFACGYPSKDDFSRRLEAKIKNISIRNGLNTDLKIDTDVFDIEFELIGDKKMMTNFIIIEDYLINVQEILYTERDYNTDDLKIVMKNERTFIIDADKSEDILNSLVRLTQAERQD